MRSSSNIFSFISFFIILLCFISFSNGLIHHLHVHEDTRGSFFIESFGYEVGGELYLNISNINTNFGSLLPENHRIGFYVKHAKSNYHRFLQEHPDKECLLDITLEENDIIVPITDWFETIYSTRIKPQGSGFYEIYFINCDEHGEPITFTLELILSNPGPNYLSVGDMLLPYIFSIFAFLYFIIISAWIYYYIIPRERNLVLNIHYLMTVAVMLKFGAVFFHAVELHYLAKVGHPGGWTWVYLIFSLLKGVTFFIVVALIGTGWAFIKPYLTERDRNVFLIVIPLQIISNIALIIVEETAPGSRSWFAWYDIFRLVDIICCIAILVPIVGSIKHLEEAGKVDGKAAKNAKKLKLFREFYLLVVSYIYFTRIIVFLLNSTLFYNWIWVSTFVSESCTLTFFAITGYYFRPVKENPYLKIDPDDDDNDNNESSDV